MTDIVPFDYGDYKIRVVIIDGEPWFVALDICRGLGIKNNRQVVSRLDDDEYRGVTLNDAMGRRNPNTRMVNQSGLYDLMLDSRKPEAKRFRRWITSEVLPSIRKTGSYSVNGPMLRVLSIAETHLQEYMVRIRVSLQSTPRAMRTSIQSIPAIPDRVTGSGSPARMTRASEGGVRVVSPGYHHTRPMILQASVCAVQSGWS